MRTFFIFACLVFVGGAITARPLEAQYPFLDPSDRCYALLTESWSIPMPANVAAAWSDADLLKAYARRFTLQLRWVASFDRIELLYEEDTYEDIMSRQEYVKLIEDCIPKIVALIERIGDRLKELGVDIIVLESEKGYERLTREQLMEDCNESLRRVSKKAKDALKRLGR